MITTQETLARPVSLGNAATAIFAALGLIDVALTAVIGSSDAPPLIVEPRRRRSRAHHAAGPGAAQRGSRGALTAIVVTRVISAALAVPGVFLEHAPAWVMAVVRDSSSPPPSPPWSWCTGKPASVSTAEHVEAPGGRRGTARGARTAAPGGLAPSTAGGLLAGMTSAWPMSCSWSCSPRGRALTHRPGQPTTPSAPVSTLAMIPVTAGLLAVCGNRLGLGAITWLAIVAMIVITATLLLLILGPMPFGAQTDISYISLVFIFGWVFTAGVRAAGVRSAAPPGRQLRCCAWASPGWPGQRCSRRRRRCRPTRRSSTSPTAPGCWPPSRPRWATRPG